MSYQVLLIPSAQKDLDPFQGDVFSKLCKALKNLSENPRPVGSIKLASEEGYRIRIGDYRIVYRIDDKGKKVYIYRIRHRREVYR